MEVSLHMQISNAFDFQLYRHTSIGLLFLFIQITFYTYNLHTYVSLQAPWFTTVQGLHISQNLLRPLSQRKPSYKKNYDDHERKHVTPFSPIDVHRFSAQQSVSIFRAEGYAT
jgi:hypothetical protein